MGAGGDAAFLLALQLVGIDLAGAAVFRLFGVGPRGQRYPHGHPWAARAAGVVLVAAFAGLLAVQFGSAPPSLVRAGLEERARAAARDALRGDAEVRLIEVDAVFPRPEHGADHPLLVRVSVEPRGGAAAGATKAHTARRVGEAVARRVPRARPLVDVTVLEPPPAEARRGP